MGNIYLRTSVAYLLLMLSCQIFFTFEYWHRGQGREEQLNMSGPRDSQEVHNSPRVYLSLSEKNHVFPINIIKCTMKRALRTVLLFWVTCLQLLVTRIHCQTSVDDTLHIIYLKNHKATADDARGADKNERSLSIDCRHLNKLFYDGSTF